MLTRRLFNQRVGAGLLGAAVAPSLLLAQEERPVACRATLINPDRLWQSLMKLSEFGRNPDGGTSRVGFSAEDLAARHWLMGELEAQGLEVVVDAAANIHARRAGERDDLPALWFGSHIDTVPNGGNFDGCVGSMSALEVIRAMNDKEARTEHPLELVIWSNEEGVHYGRGLFGSRAFAGLLDPGELEAVDEKGEKLADWIRRYGGDPERIADMVPPPASIHSYLELHIEQGGILWQRNIPLGIVEGIVGIDRYRVVLEGFANHAGTTPMNQRRDALVTAAKIIQAVREIVIAEPGRQVGTVGYVRVEPGAPNVIPGRVEFPVEIRDLSMEKIKALAEHVRARGAELAAADNVGFTWEATSSHQPALTDRRIRLQIQKAVEEMRAPTLTMPSGAGHDAQSMAHLCPVGMIFVPSKDGISHSPAEYSRPERVACGCEALYRSLLLLDGVERFA
ncbi:MAG: Zn-dependent hydrolase [Acidobacteria bacterium]|nr:Zn-dependent hydrolase [Acidobacteriota bacterium]